MKFPTRNEIPNGNEEVILDASRVRV
jgi:hypothetical protein